METQDNDPIENKFLLVLNIFKGFLVGLAALTAFIVYLPKAAHNIYKWTIESIKNGINKGSTKSSPPK